MKRNILTFSAYVALLVLCAFVVCIDAFLVYQFGRSLYMTIDLWLFAGKPLDPTQSQDALRLLFAVIAILVQLVFSVNVFRKYLVKVINFWRSSDIQDDIRKARKKRLEAQLEKLNKTDTAPD